MSFYERIPAPDFHSMVGLSTAGATNKAIQRHRMGRTARPTRLDPGFTMAATSVHRRASSTHKTPDAARALAAFRTGL
jgi:hypothetical protein